MKPLTKQDEEQLQDLTVKWIAHTATKIEIARARALLARKEATT